MEDEFKLGVKVVCSKCGGSGTSVNGRNDCPVCRGSGYVIPKMSKNK